jgi:hypothetical protein
LICCSASLSSTAHSQLLLLSRRFSSFSHIHSAPSFSHQQQKFISIPAHYIDSPHAEVFNAFLHSYCSFPFFHSFFFFSHASILLDFLNCLFACLLYACHLMQRCLNCQSNFRLKVFLLFLTPTAVSLFVYSFFCFSRASILLDFLNCLFTLPPLRMPPHVMLCSTICVSASVVLQSCSSTRVSAVVFQHSCSSIRVPAVVFQHLRLSICDSAFVFQHFSFYVPVSLVRVVNLDCFITDCHQ